MVIVISALQNGNEIVAITISFVSLFFFSVCLWQYKVLSILN
jgi:hypothetical protein